MAALGAANELIDFGLPVYTGSRQRPQAGNFNWIRTFRFRPAQTVEPETGFPGDGSRDETVSMTVSGWRETGRFHAVVAES